MALMYYLIYKTTNNITGKFYIGTHKTRNKNDSYMGSGKYLNHAIKKYGIEDFTKEILFEFNNPDDMFAKEAEIVNEDFLASENTYNLKKGGFGGFDYINRNELFEKGHQNRTEESFERMSYYGRLGGIKSKEQGLGFHSPTNRIIGWKTEQQRLNAHNASMSHTSNEKRKKTMKDIHHQSGYRNSQYGTMWITNGIDNQKINKEDTIPSGWKKGRT